MSLENYAKPKFEHFNLDENGVTVIDKSEETPKIAQISFKSEGLWCDFCVTNFCIHIDYALSQADIGNVLEQKRKSGWKIPRV